MAQENNLLQTVLEDTINNGVIAKGYLEVVRSIQQKKAKIVIVAEDIDKKKLLLEIKRLCNIYEVNLITGPSRQQLGKLIGLDIKTGFVSIKIAGLNKKGFFKLIKIAAKASANEESQQ